MSSIDLRLAQGEPSVTAQGAAALRAAHQLLDVPLVFEDPFAVRILGSDGEWALRNKLPSQQTPTARAMRALVVGRSRFAEDRLAQAVDLGVRQYVLLGAGLDTYALRHPDGPARVFEIDHPATQAWKRPRLLEIGVAPPACLTFIPVDFEKGTLQVGLADAGFDSSAPAMVAWLGVSVSHGGYGIRDLALGSGARERKRNSLRFRRAQCRAG
jgi:methyltransferase (TIGR00027 family)